MFRKILFAVIATMIRKIFSTIAAFSLVALFAMGEIPPSSAAAQTLSNSGRVTSSNMTLEITTMDLLGTNSMIVGWTIKKTGTVTIQPYEIRLELSRNGVTERLVKTASASAASVNFDLRGISADKRARLFGPGLKATVVVKATFLRHQGSVAQKSILEVNKTKTFSVADAGPIAK